jgi:hypothetical protein
MRVTVPERETIRAYVEDRILEEVVHLEKTGTELVGPARYDIWDVLSTDGRWWVITNPLCLYRQVEFKRNVALHFHIGLMLRTSYRPGSDVPGRKPDPSQALPGSWQCWEQALEAYDSCEEAGNFQAVGDRLRGCMIAFISETARGGPAPAADGSHQAAEVRAWANLQASSLAAGNPKRHLRSHLTELSVATWDYINWLTHTRNATRVDAEVGLKEVYHFLSVFGGGVPEQR